MGDMGHLFLMSQRKVSTGMVSVLIIAYCYYMPTCIMNQLRRISASDVVCDLLLSNGAEQGSYVACTDA